MGKKMTGEEFKKLRKKLNLTQTQCGDLLGYSRQQVLNWEKNKYAVDKSAGMVLTLLERIGDPELVDEVLNGEKIT